MLQPIFVKYHSVQRASVDGPAIDADFAVVDPDVRIIVVPVQDKGRRMPEDDRFAGAVLLLVERVADPEEIFRIAVVPILFVKVDAGMDKDVVLPLIVERQRRQEGEEIFVMEFHHHRYLGRRIFLLDVVMQKTSERRQAAVQEVILGILLGRCDELLQYLFVVALQVNGALLLDQFLCQKKACLRVLPAVAQDRR